MPQIIYFRTKKSLVILLQVKMLSNELLFTLLIFLCCLHISLQNNYLLALKDEFKMKHITIIKNESYDDAKLMKLAFEYALFTKICRNAKKISLTKDMTSHMLIYINPKNNIQIELKPFLIKQQILVMLILQDQQFEKFYNELEFEISHQVFMLKESSQEMYETYIINDHHIRRKLGHIDLRTNKFTWDKNVNSYFYKRRANFHGLVLKAMAEVAGLEMSVYPTYINDAPYHSNNQTYLMNGYTYGFFNDILHTLEYELNFTSLIYKRKDSVWGYIYPQSNGSYVGTGIVGDIFFKRADMALTIGFNLKRALYIDYLPPPIQQIAAVYTPSLDEKESLDFMLFISPLTINVWIIVCIISILKAVLKSFIFYYYSSFHISDFCPAIWTSFIAFFGGKPTAKSFDSETAYKIVVFISLFSGSLVWIFYRSYLTSALSITRLELPFTDMKSFSKTNWRYQTN